MGRVSGREEGAQALPVLRVVHGLDVVLAWDEPELTLPARRFMETQGFGVGNELVARAV